MRMLKNFASLAALAVGLLILAGVAQAAPTGAPNTTYYVSATTGNDANNGLTPATATKTIMAVMNAIRPTTVAYVANATNSTNSGCTVKVAAGTYAENVVFPTSGTTLMGGYTADFSSRDWKANQSIIDPNAGANLGYTVGFDTVAKRHQCIILNIYTPNGSSNNNNLLPCNYCTVDGFKLVNGGPGETQNARKGGGIWAYAAKDLVLKNLEIANCDVSQSPTNTPGTGFGVGNGAGIYIQLCNLPTLDNIEVHDCQIQTTSTTGAVAGGTPTAFSAQTGWCGIRIDNSNQPFTYSSSGITWLATAVSNTQTPISLTNLNVHDNFGGNGMLLYNQNNTVLTAPAQAVCYWKIWDSKFWDCICNQGGAGINIYPGSATVTPTGGVPMSTICNSVDVKRCWFYNNTASNGGGIYCQWGNALSLTDCFFSNCKMEGGQGGGVCFSNGNAPSAIACVIDRCAFVGCWASAAVSYTYPRSALSDYNELAEPYGSYGAAIGLVSQGSTTYNQVYVRNCAVVGTRGARGSIGFNGAGTTLMSNMTIDHNYGKGDTVVYHLTSAAVTTFANTLMTNNVPGIGRRSYDAAVVRDNVAYPSTLKFNHCVYQNNYFTSGSFHNGGPGTVANTAIVYFTTVTSMGVPVYLRPIIGVLSSATGPGQPAGETYVPLDSRGVIYTGDHLPAVFCYGGVNTNRDLKPYYVQDGAGATTGTWTSWSDTCSRFGQVAPATASHWGPDFFLKTANFMTLTDTKANWVPGSLVGRYLFPVDPDKRLMNPYPYAGGSNKNKRAAQLILSNTANSLVCTGRLEDVTTCDQTPFPPIGTAQTNMPPDYAIESDLTGMPYKICDYHLQAISPAVDQGDGSVGFNGAGVKDLAGNRRFAGNIDIGAYELVGPNAIGNHWTLFQ